MSSTIVTNKKTDNRSDGLVDNLCSKSDTQVKSMDEAKLVVAAAIDTRVLGVNGRAVMANWASCSAVSSNQKPYTTI